MSNPKYSPGIIIFLLLMLLLCLFPPFMWMRGEVILNDFIFNNHGSPLLATWNAGEYPFWRYPRTIYWSFFVLEALMALIVSAIIQYIVNYRRVLKSERYECVNEKKTFKEDHVN